MDLPLYNACITGRIAEIYVKVDLAKSTVFELTKMPVRSGEYEC